MRNKIIVNVYLPFGHNQKDEEYSVSWSPINFQIYSSLFQELVDMAVEDWLSGLTLKHEIVYELIFEHLVDHDGAGAVMSESFDLIHSETDGQNDFVLNFE